MTTKRVFLHLDEGEDGWTEWIHPLPGYLMMCCDCGLTHELEFAITPAENELDRFNHGESRDAVVVHRARRVEREFPHPMFIRTDKAAWLAHCAIVDVGLRGDAAPADYSEAVSNAIKSSATPVASKTWWERVKAWRRVRTALGERKPGTPKHPHPIPEKDYNR